jgi:hypothetical protein
MTLCYWGTDPQQQCFGVVAFVSNPSSFAHSKSTVLSKSNARTFVPASTPRRVCQQRHKGQQHKQHHQQSSTQLHFMGSEGGVLGIGTPELVRRLGKT